MKTFDWFPDIDGQQEIRPSVNVTKFGDGYEHRAAVGINTQKRNWTLTFNRSREEVKEIEQFLREHNAVSAFTWRTPLGDSGRYVCRSWKVTSKKGMLSLSCTFEQVFEY
ncbi:phage tail protein [Oxalobacter sp. OttesenSCG-928-P03]|nr:phage tail protein [Oxalobacter sp. OttesenSCG-928-P03]